MNKQLDEVISRLKTLSMERQQQAAVLLLDFLERKDEHVCLSPEQIAEIERALSDDEPFATEDEVRATFERLKT
jgi:hypothetical protein